MAARDAAAQRSAVADEMLLPDELVQVSRPHPCGEGLPLGWRLEEGLWLGAGQSAHGWHDAMVAPVARDRRPAEAVRA